MSVSRFILPAFFLMASSLVQAEGVGSAFTYQGELQQLGVPTNGAFDFEFELFNVATLGAPVAGTVQVEDIVTVDGVFTVNLDFGSAAFGDEKLWLQIAVRDGASEGGYTLLSPRQVITPTPFALQAQFANKACSLGACTYPGTASLTCDSVSVTMNCEVPGTNWTTHSAAEANQWRSVTYGDGLFVAVAIDGEHQVMTSPDGITWTPRTHATPSNLWSSVAYGNGMFVAVQYAVMTSPDGINWTYRLPGVSGATQWRSVTYGGGQFVAVANTGPDRVMTSPDGITWTTQSASENIDWSAVTYGDGQFVAVANLSNRVMTSPDGVNWTGYTATEANAWGSVTYGGGLFVAVTWSGVNQVMTSPDGMNWTPRSASGPSYWRSVTWSGGLFVAVANGGGDGVMTSPDGIAWTGHSVENSQWFSVVPGGGKIVAIATDGANRVMTSP